ncbi:MAG: hypothetical protein AB7G11_07205 [Phycisphaerales bacterium]
MSCLAAAAISSAMLACSNTPPSADIALDASEYAPAFDAARLVLRDMRFDLERIDARVGVISTAPKRTAGLATPWDREQQTAGQELEDLVQHQRRVVRVTFVPADPASSATGASPDAAAPDSKQLSDQPPADDGFFDLLDTPQPTTMSVRAYFQRVNRPNWQVDSTSIRLNHYAYDPELAARDLVPSYDVTFAEDRDLSARLADLIRQRMTPRN